MLRKYVKLTDKHSRTYGECQWGEGVEHTADGEGELCSEHWIHVYEHPLLAVLHDPVHGKFLDDEGARLWECESDDDNPKRDGQMKLGIRHLCTVQQIPIPEITFEQRVAYAIHCALHVYIEPVFVDWAEKWLTGEDRSRHATSDAAYAAYAADAAYAAYAADAADATYDADAAYAAGAAASAAHAAHAAAGAYATHAAHAAHAAYAAHAAAGSIDLAAIAEQVCDTFYW